MAAILILLGSISALIAGAISYVFLGMTFGQAALMYFAVGGSVFLLAFAWSRVSFRPANTVLLWK